MSYPNQANPILDEIRERTDAEIAARIQNSADPLILVKLAEACGGDVARLTNDIARQVVFISEADTNRAAIEEGFRERYGN